MRPRRKVPWSALAGANLTPSNRLFFVCLTAAVQNVLELNIRWIKTVSSPAALAQSSTTFPRCDLSTGELQSQHVCEKLQPSAGSELVGRSAATSIRLRSYVKRVQLGRRCWHDLCNGGDRNHPGAATIFGRSG